MVRYNSIGQDAVPAIHSMECTKSGTKEVSNFKVQPSSQVKPSYKEVLKAVVALIDQMNSDELAFAYKPEY